MSGGGPGFKRRQRMADPETGHRYEMVNVRPGYVIVEHEVHSKQMRSFFSSEAIPPVEEYREGPKVLCSGRFAGSGAFRIL